MATGQDCSIGRATESTFRTYAAPTRFLEFTDESLGWKPNVKQGQGLRTGARLARSGRRTVPTADGGGDFSVELASKGLGLLWNGLFGAGTSTLVGGTTYQQVFTLADTQPSLTIQKGLPQVGGTVDAYSFLGCTVDGIEFDFPNGDICTAKVSVDAADLTTAQSYAAPSYPAAPVNLFHFAGGTVSTGTLTAPTATALASAVTATANVRSGNVQISRNVVKDRFTFGGAGRKSQQKPGVPTVSGKLEIEYDQSTYRDAILNDTGVCVVLTFTAGALSTGLETFQLVLPEIRFNGELPKANGGDIIVQSLDFDALDNLTAAQPIWLVTRTADTAL